MQIGANQWRVYELSDAPAIAQMLADEPWAWAYHDPHSGSLARYSTRIAEGQAKAIVCLTAAEPCDHSLHGFVGVGLYGGPQARWQTSTFLCRCQRGKGTGESIKTWQGQAARELDAANAVPGQALLVASIHEGNHRSRRNMQKLYPEAPRQMVREDWLAVPRWSELVTLIS
jgi:hypothetical protein